jgi:hypothetical protein
MQSLLMVMVMMVLVDELTLRNVVIGLYRSTRSSARPTSWWAWSTTRPIRACETRMTNRASLQLTNELNTHARTHHLERLLLHHLHASLLSLPERVHRGVKWRRPSSLLGRQATRGGGWWRGRRELGKDDRERLLHRAGTDLRLSVCAHSLVRVCVCV